MGAARPVSPRHWRRCVSSSATGRGGRRGRRATIRIRPPRACAMRLRKTSSLCAPETAYLEAKMKNGTPSTPSRRASSISACTSCGALLARQPLARRRRGRSRARPSPARRGRRCRGRARNNRRTAARPSRRPAPASLAKRISRCASSVFGRALDRVEIEGDARPRRRAPSAAACASASRDGSGNLALM